jgi:4-amino-4-deoxy-L-arabinose transferase-like glycosyltransferase
MADNTAKPLRTGRRWLAPVGLAILIAGAFFFRLGQDMPMRHHEALVAVTARNIVLDRPVHREDGTRPSPWLVPNFNGNDRLRKTPLPYWIVAELSTAAGGVSEWTARIPSAVSAAGTAIVLLFILRRWTDRRTAYLGAAVLVTSLGFLNNARAAQADMLMTFFTTASLVALWMAVERTGRSRFGWLVLTGLAAGLAMMAKGPAPLPVLGLPYVVAAATMILRLIAAGRGGRSAAAEWTWTLGGAVVAVVLFCVIFLPWLLLVPNAWSTVWGEMTGHSVGADMDPDESSPLSFIMRFPVLLGPWTIFVAGGLYLAIVGAWRDRSERAWLIFVLTWIGGTLAVFSLAAIRRDHYILPAYPAAAVFAALCMRHFIRRAEAGFRFPDFGLWLLHGASSIVLGLVGVAAYGMFVANPEFYRRHGMPEAFLVPAVFGPVGVLGAVNLIAGITMCVLAVRRRLAYAAGVLAVVMTITWVGAWATIWSSTDRSVALRNFGEYIHENVPADATIYCVGSGNRTVIYYADREISSLRNDEEVAAKMAEGRPFFLVLDTGGSRQAKVIKGLDEVRLLTDPWHPGRDLLLMKYPGR